MASISTWFKFSAISCLLLVAPARAEETKTAPEEFREMTEFKYLMCSIKLRSELMTGPANAGDDYVDCKRSGRAETKPLFVKALAKTKKPAAAKLLKLYYAAWLTAFDGLSPGSEELKTTYEQRKMANKAKSDELWSQFEIESM